MGISSLLGGIALVGFLAFLGGIGLSVVAASQGRPVRNGVSLALVGIVVGLVFSVVSQGIILVGAAEVAVVFNTVSGGLDPTPRRSGTHVIIPVAQTAQIYNIRQQEYTMAATTSEGSAQGNDSVSGRTNDGQEVQFDVTVIYRIDPAMVNQVHVDWGTSYLINFIRPTTRSLIRDVVSQYTAEEIYGEARTDVTDTMEAVIRTRLAEEGFELSDLLVRDVNFSAEFTQSIEQKQVAEQQALQAEIRVRQEQQEAERVRVRAQGQRDAAIAAAEGESQAIILRASAEAEALRLVSEQIAANPALIQYIYVQNLSDNVQLALVPSNSPFLFDFATLLEGGQENFNAPEVPASSLGFIDPLTGQVPGDEPEVGADSLGE